MSQNHVQSVVSATPLAPSNLQTEAQLEERRLIRRLQMMMNMVMQVISQDETLTIDDASQMIADSRRATEAGASLRCLSLVR